ncbi:MAG: aminotransferase class IV [Balneolia bacterium]|nr:aminotransferase class IV [Balneolia bacterium]
MIFNNQLVPATEAMLPADCRAVSLGESCFETFRVRAGASVLGFELHLQRMMRGAVMLGYDVRKHASFFLAADCAVQIITLLEKQKLTHTDARVRIQIGRLDRSGISGQGEPEFFYLIKAAEATKAGQPVKIDFNARERIPAGASDSSVKWSYYAPNVMELNKAKSQGFDDALLNDAEGNVSCTTTANVFFVKDNEIITPWLQSGALHGITRKLLIGVLLEKGIHVNEKPVTRAEAEECDAAFITSSVREISAVTRLGEFEKDAHHPLLQDVMQTFAEYRRNHRKNLADL